MALVTVMLHIILKAKNDIDVMTVNSIRNESAGDVTCYDGPENENNEMKTMSRIAQWLTRAETIVAGKCEAPEEATVPLFYLRYYFISRLMGWMA